LGKANETELGYCKQASDFYFYVLVAFISRGISELLWIITEAHFYDFSLSFNQWS